jgi:hypothetical protein
LKKQRYQYALIILIVIIVGLLSRKTTLIPVLTGDALYATMMYFMVRFCLLKAKIKKVALISIGICFAIEFSQMYQAPWINNIRATLPGRLILGQGFVWKDLPAYVAGVAIACLADVLMKRNK